MASPGERFESGAMTLSRGNPLAKRARLQIDLRSWQAQICSMDPAGSLAGTRAYKKKAC
jgi:hypothetical protein